MRKIIFINLLIIIITVQLCAQTEPWVRISPKPIESSLQEITRIPGTNRMMALGTGAAILYTDDMGENWNIIYKPADIPRETGLNAISFVDENIGYAVGSESTLIKTTDGGMTWVDISPAGDKEFDDVYFHNELYGFITKINTVLRTTDGCQTWDLEYISSGFHPKHLHFTNDTTGYIGDSWSSYYYKTVDGGENWGQVNINPFIENFKLSAILFINENIGFISGEIYSVSNVDNIILRTNDGGNSWTQVYSHYFNYVHHFYFYNSDTGFAVGPRVMYDNMILRTTDGGLNWQECNMPYSYWYLNSINFSDEGTGLCVGNRGQTYSSYDWGENWEKTSQSACEPGNTITDAQIIEDSIVFFVTSNSSAGVPSGSIYKSIDAGASWDYSFSGYPFNSIHFLNPLYGFACGPDIGKVYKTTDGGESWDGYEINYWNFSPECVYFINEQIGFVGGEENYFEEIYKTTDGGENWYKINTILLYMFYNITDFEFIDDSNGFAVGPDYYYGSFLARTNDQGETWTADSLGFFSEPKKIHFLNSDTGFIIGSNNLILKTIDGGDNWYEVPSGISGSISFLDINFPTNQTGYITASENEVTIIKTTDCGETWEPIEFPCTATPRTVDFFNENEGLFMGNSGIIFKTYTGGVVSIPEFTEDKTKEIDWHCYPNPVKDILNIKLNLANDKYPDVLIFYDIFGRKIKKIEIPEKQETIKLDVSEWKNGVYFVISVFNGKIIREGKFVKVN